MFHLCANGIATYFDDTAATLSRARERVDPEGRGEGDSARIRSPCRGVGRCALYDNPVVGRGLSLDPFALGLSNHERHTNLWPATALC